MTYRIITFALFFLAAILVVCFAYWFLNRRIVATSKLSGQRKKWLGYLLKFMIFFPLVGLPMRFAGGLLSDIFSWITYVSLGILIFLFTFTLVRDGIFWLIHWARLLRSKSSGRQATISRRELFSLGYNKLVTGSALAVATYGMYEARRLAQVQPQQVTLKNLPAAFDGLRIAQVSDIHIGLTIKKGFLQAIVDQVNKLNPDLVAITGDLVDGSVSQLFEHVSPLAQLRSTYGSFFCTGNHEYYSGAKEWVEALKSLNVKTLLNENVAIKKGNEQVYLAGVTDYRAGRFHEEHTTSVKKAVEGLVETDCCILLAHNPYSITEAGECKVDLQLSGHTHGGQFFPGSLIVHLVYPYVKGLHQHSENTQIYVNRGTGYWGPPVRAGMPSEITLLTLKATQG